MPDARKSFVVQCRGRPHRPHFAIAQTRSGCIVLWGC